MHASPRLLPAFFFCALPAAHAQLEPNVRTEYAEVLRVEPVTMPAPLHDGNAQCASMLRLDLAPARNAGAECVPLPPAQEDMPQQLYDVDYVLRGIKYRSRLPFDPGNRLQVQLSVTPLIPPENP